MQKVYIFDYIYLNKMKLKTLFREEKNGGYKFNREDGTAEFYEGDKFREEIKKAEDKKESFDRVERPENASDLALTAPLAIWHETTQACNLSCKDCGRRKTGEEDLDIKKINKIYRDLSASGVFEVRVTGGEACIRPDIEQIVESAKDNGFYVSLTSNGVYTADLRERVVNLPIGLYILSLDGTRQINDAIRGRGSYESTLTTIKELTAAGKNVRVNTVLMQQTKDCIEELVDILIGVGVKALTLIPLRPTGTAAQNFDGSKLSPKEYMNTVELVGRFREKYLGFSIATNYDVISTTSQGENVPSYWSKMCIAGIEAACVSPSGSLRACILAPIGDAGNLLQNSFYELWHNDALWGIFRDMDRRVLEQCRKCEDYKIKCPGSCIAMTEYLRASGKKPREIYCFRGLMKKQ